MFCVQARRAELQVAPGILVKKKKIKELGAYNASRLDFRTF